MILCWQVLSIDVYKQLRVIGHLLTKLWSPIGISISVGRVVKWAAMTGLKDRPRGCPLSTVRCQQARSRWTGHSGLQVRLSWKNWSTWAGSIQNVHVQQWRDVCNCLYLKAPIFQFERYPRFNISKRLLKHRGQVFTQWRFLIQA